MLISVVYLIYYFSLLFGTLCFPLIPYYIAMQRDKFIIAMAIEDVQGKRILCALQYVKFTFVYFGALHFNNIII